MVTSKQIKALKYMIFNSKDGTDVSKRLLAFLIDQSEKLTKEVCITLSADHDGYNADEIRNIANNISSMKSSNSRTHLSELLEVMGSKLNFSLHYGDFDPTRIDNLFNNDGQFAGLSTSQVTRPGLVIEGMPLRYTFWLSKNEYSRQATFLIVTREILEQINLEKPGLYPSIEPA